MRKASYLQRLAVFSVGLLFVLVSDSLAQNRERFVISAKAGGINSISGQAILSAKGQADWQQLMVTDNLDAGDRVKTAGDGRVEILLNPGSYLRLGGNSEVELANNSLDDLQVRLLRGTAIVEATGADGIQLNINISTPHAKLAIVRHGLYRLDVFPEDATTELIVRKGRVLLNDSHTKVNGGNKVIFSSTTVSVAKLTDAEKKDKDDVEVWSKDRAELVAKANRRITGRMMTSAFSAWNGFGFGRWGFRSSGFWFYNSSSRCYTFLPFGFGWGSPYGSSYSTSIYSPSYFGWGRGRITSWPAHGSSGSSSTSYPSTGTGNWPTGTAIQTPPSSTRPPITSRTEPRETRGPVGKRMP